jgi:hypothetical protein
MFHLSTVDHSTFRLLQAVSKTDFIKNHFALAGGTSLALQIGHRRSIDLDFFSPNEFSTYELEIILAGSAIWKYEPASRSERMLFCFLDKIKCDFVNEPFPLIEPYHEEQGIMLYSLKDIAAMKLHTICGRVRRKTFLMFMFWFSFLDGTNFSNGSSRNMVNRKPFICGKAFRILKTLSMMLTSGESRPMTFHGPK